MWFLDRHRSILIFLILLLGIAWFFLLGLGIYGALAAELNEKLDYLRFAIGISTFGVTIYALYYSSVSSSYLRSAFGLGLWRGYSRNFLDRVVRSFQDQGERPPFFVLASPSYSVIGSLDFPAFLETHLPAALESRGYKIESLYGNEIGKPASYRQAFRIARKDRTDWKFLDRVLFFDFPTTLISFEGAADALAKQKKKPLDSDGKSKEFEKMKEDFFSAGAQWAEHVGTSIFPIDMPNNDVALFAKVLTRKLEDASDGIGLAYGSVRTIVP